MTLKILYRFFFFSILIHIILFLLGFILLSYKKENPQPFKKIVFLEIPNLPQPKKSFKNRQIVQSKLGEKVDQPNADAFLGLENRRVLEETVNRQPQSLSPIDQKQIGLSSENSKKSMHHKDQVTRPLDLSQLGIPLFVPQKQKPSHESLQALRQDGGSRVVSSNDYVLHKKDSDQTVLNTREYVFYSYFQRIRSSLDQAWTRIVRNKLMNYYQNGHHFIENADHITQVLVSLDPSGKIIRIQILNASGYQDLDDAVVEAFNQAGPFLNPPKAMVDENDEIKIDWSFVLRT